jgi:PleD family two-component response regulator
MHRKKVLLVDDSSTILLMERMILSKEPFDLITAINGEDAVVKAASEKPDPVKKQVPMVADFEIPSGAAVGA